MRLALFFVVTLAASGCKKQPVEAAPSPYAAGAPTPTPTPEVAEPTAAPAEPAPAPTEQPSRLVPPTPDELRTALTPTFATIGRCIGRTRISEPPPFTLKLSVSPAGSIDGAQIVQLPAAKDCVIDALSRLRFAPWRGEAAIVTIPVGADGQPNTFVSVDAGAGKP